MILVKKIKKGIDKSKNVLYSKLFAILWIIMWRWNKWQNALFAERALHSVATYPILTEKPTDLGSPTSGVLRLT